MPVDASPYRNQHQPENLLTQIAQLKGAADTLGEIEVGKGMQAAIQPDGTVDRNALAQHLKQSIVGGMKAAPALTAIEQLRNAGYATDAQGIRTLMERARYIGASLGPLAGADVSGVKQSDLIGVAGKMLKDANKYGISVPDIADTLKETTGMSDAQRAQYVKNKVFQAQELSKVLEATLPQVETVDTGGTVERFGTGTRQRPQGFSVEKGIPPTTETRDDRRMIPDPSNPGRMIENPNYGQRQLVGPGGSGRPSITRQTASPDAPPVRQATEGARVVSRGPTVDPRTGAPIADSTFDAIRQRGQRPAAAAGASPSSPPPATVVQSQAAPTPAQAVAQRFPTSLPPGAERVLESGAEAYTKELETSRGYQDRVQPLREAIPRLEKLGTRGTGPGTETYNDVKSFAQTWGLPVPNAAALKDFAEAKKYLTQNAIALAPPGTNIPSVTAAFEANPNVSQPNNAATYLAKSMLTLARLKQAAITSFRQEVQSGRAQPNQFNEWASDWISKQDPRAFGADLWSKDDRAKLSKTLKEGSPQAKRFRASLDEARRLGLLGDVERPTEK